MPWGECRGGTGLGTCWRVGDMGREGAGEELFSDHSGFRVAGGGAVTPVLGDF